jgi:uncharacterized protein YqhQ
LVAKELQVNMKIEEKEKIMPIGGQAVIEGVMMRSPRRIATALRRADGTIEVKTDEYVSLIHRKKILNIPIIRGAITLIEVMMIGIKALHFSADKAMLDLEEKTGKDGRKRSREKKAARSNIGVVFTTIVALTLGIALFFMLPIYLTTEIFNIEKEALLFNLVAGIIRIFFFLIYIWLISFMKDVQRIFEYHGAEHKSVFAFENKEYLSPENVEKYTTHHPRCGTSFLVIVMIVSLLFFIILDTIILLVYGKINLFIRFITHIPLIPVVGGLSYEVLKASAKKLDSKFVNILIKPGLALQKITTRQPDKGQLEVAIHALKAALGEEGKGELVPEKI